MHHPLEGLARMCEWVGKDYAYNLDFIPEDRFDWKPAPTAKSAKELTHEAIQFTRAVTRYFQGEGFVWDETPPGSTREETKAALVTAANAYAQQLRQIPPERLSGTVEWPFGTFPCSMAASLPVIELIHHRGQAIYIQSLLGDAEAHFAPLE